MGEPLLGSLICGSLALGMVLWNWHLMEAQKRRSRKAARESAIAAAAAGRERSMVSAGANEMPPQPLRIRHSLSSYDVIKLDPLAHSGSHESSQDPSPKFVKEHRDRAETSPISPPISSPRAAEMGFFKDE